MKKPIKLWFMVLGVGAVIALAFFGWSAKAKDASTFHLANGVEVTPIAVKSDNLAQLLDAKFWKFDVNLPDATREYNYTLCLYRYGKFVKAMDGAGIGFGRGNDHHVLVTIGLIPLENTSGTAQRLKCNIHTGSTAVTSSFANPFLKNSWYMPTTQPVEADDLIYLMNGSKSIATSSNAAKCDTALALRIEPSRLTP